MLWSLLWPTAAQAAAASVVVEIDAAAERVVDARSARRLVPLELSDVALPTQSGRPSPVLFFRVVGRADGLLRVELWERGEYHGARTLSGAGESPQLVARRVALAAAELGRRLARRREALFAREERLRRRRLALENERLARTQDGPLALRPEVSFLRVPGQLWLVGPRLTGELSLRGPLRLDVGAELWAGVLKPSLRTEVEGLSLGPAYRIALGRRLDLDLGVVAAAALVQVPQAGRLDAISNQNSSWTARAEGAARLQAGLSRQLRLGLGLQAGALLRSVPYVASDTQPRRLHGAFWGASASVVFTPP